MRISELIPYSMRGRSFRYKRSKSLVINAAKQRNRASSPATLISADSFVNSQEWTLSRNVPDLRLGIVGAVSSGKSALVHRYLTGSYMQEESPEGGRFKKEVMLDGTSYLLLIRDEGGPPEMQFSAWVDAIILVFSVENEASFNAIYNYYSKMSHFRNPQEIPIILVGTQDAISETNPRVIDDARARKLAADLKKCTYYETCATYGLNVEKVFQDACQKIVQHRMMLGSIPRSSTPNHFATASRSAVWGCPGTPTPYLPSPTHGGPPALIMSPHASTATAFGPPPPQTYHAMPPPAAGPLPQFLKEKNKGVVLVPGGGGGMERATSSVGGVCLFPTRYSSGTQQQQQQQQVQQQQQQHCVSGGENNSSGGEKSGKTFSDDRRMMPPPLPTTTTTSSSCIDQFPTPSSTPTTSRKNRRRSNLFTPSSKKEEAEKKAKNGELGVGRAIPVKQGHLYKRSSKTLNKEWKKKYVTLCDDGRLTYHPSLQDYMDDVHGKEIDLQCTTVKYAGQHRPRVPATNGVLDMSHLSISDRNCDTENSIVISSLTVSGMDSLGSTSAMPVATASASAMCTPSSSSSSSSKKRHRRLKTSISRSKHSHHHDDGDDSDGYEFFIVSKDSKTWHFEAANAEERDEWVQAIEQCILTSLQGNESFKGKNSGAAKVNMDPSAIVSLRKAVDGNLNCCDCDAPNPDWASLNLGTLICIECSGIHRNLGSHISRVRSLGLDEWPPGPLAVMMALGNRVANSVWEGAMRQLQRPGPARPTPTTPREEKERWIRWKYEEKRFLAPLSNPAGIGQQLIDAVCRGDVKHVSLLLAHSKPEHVSVTVSSRDLRTPLHIACSMGNLPIVQLLLWNQAQVVPRDHDGLTCLEHAHCSGNANVEELVAQYCAASGSGSMLQSQANGAGTHLLQHSPSSAPGPGGNSSFSLSSSGGAGPSTALTCSPSTPQQHQQQQHQMHSPAGGAQARSLFSGRSSVMRCQEGSKGPNGLDPFEKVPSSVI